MSASLRHGHIASQLNRKAQRLAFLRLAVTCVIAVRLCVAFGFVR